MKRIALITLAILFAASPATAKADAKSCNLITYYQAYWMCSNQGFLEACLGMPDSELCGLYWSQQ